MTLSAIGMVFALVLLIAGLAYFARKDSRRTRVIGIVATVAIAVVVGWFSWLAGTQALGTRVECAGPTGCEVAAAFAIELLAQQKGEMPDRLRVHHTGEQTWLAVACWAEGRYVTVNVGLGSTPQAAYGGALYGVQPCD